MKGNAQFTMRNERQIDINTNSQSKAKHGRAWKPDPTLKIRINIHFLVQDTDYFNIVFRNHAIENQMSANPVFVYPSRISSILTPCFGLFDNSWNVSSSIFT